ncbi:MAG TPA: MFS transporter [Rhizobiaceae bacterium]|nr:MFS transporter [Rhizobiaceae bacterium]
MTASANRPETRLATRISFFAAGFAMACWAPLVPFAKANVGVDDGALGLLLLCLGAGSLVAMPLTGAMSARIGSKPMILAGGFGLVLTLPLLAAAGHPLALALVLLFFGASLGTIDVAMNIHAVEVDRDSPTPLLSGFHALFSIGGFAGAGGMTLLLSSGLAPVVSAVLAGALTLVAMIVVWPRLLRRPVGEPAPLALPRGIVLVISLLAFIMFLVEGAMLDWSALFVMVRGLLEPAQGGLAYMLFAIAMTIGRLTGDRVVAWLGNLRVIVFGGLVAIGGFVLLLTAPWTPLALASFALIGFGAANIVPVLFSLAGRQKVMPVGLAVAAMTTIGYAGILAGPAAVGFVSQALGLPAAFWMLAALTVVVPLLARTVTRVDG